MGRPRGFETDEALAAITGVFWERGFEGTSMQDIEAATGLNKQSLYRAFGDKRAMYRAALDGFADVLLATAAPVFDGSGTPREKFAAFYDMFITGALQGDRRGCFLCNATTDQAQLDAGTQGSLQRAIAQVLAVFERVLGEAAPYAGDKAEARAMAEAQLAVYFGLTVLIKAGLGEDALRNTAEKGVSLI